MSADLWAGAEVQVATTAAYLTRQPGVSVAAVLFNDGPLATELRRLGVDVTIIDESTTSAFGILRRLTRLFRDNRFDLIHTHRYKDSVLGACAAKLAGVPHVVRTVHGLREPLSGWRALKFRVYEALDRAALLFCADLVIAVSARMAETLRTSGYRPTSVTKIHNGVDLRDARAEAVAGKRPSRAGHRRRRTSSAPPAGCRRSKGMPASFGPPAWSSRPVRHEVPHRWQRSAARRAARSGNEAADCRRLRADRRSGRRPRSDGRHGHLRAAVARRGPADGGARSDGARQARGRDRGRRRARGHRGRRERPARRARRRTGAGGCMPARDRHRGPSTLGTRARRLVEERFSHEQSGRALLAAYRSVALVPRIAHPHG